MSIATSWTKTTSILLCLVACKGKTSQSDTSNGSLGEQRLGLCDIYGIEGTSADSLGRGQDGWIQLAKNLGVPIVRPHRSQGHVFSWNVVDNGGESYDFTLTDIVVDTITRNELDLLVTVYPKADLSIEANHRMDVIDLEIEGDPQDYAAFVQALAERYDGDGVDDMPGLERPVDAWEAGNEPYCPSGDSECYDRQYELLQYTADAIHAADPNATVLPAGARPVFMGTAHDQVTGDWMVGEDAEIWQALFDRGALDLVDAFSFHLQVGSTEVHVDDYIEYWREQVGNKPLWITETGVYGGDGFTDTDDPIGWTNDHLQTAFDRDVDTVLWCWWEQIRQRPDLFDALSAFTKQG